MTVTVAGSGCLDINFCPCLFNFSVVTDDKFLKILITLLIGVNIYCAIRWCIAEHFITYLSNVLGPSLPRRPAAQCLRRTHRQNTGSWLVDARNSTAGTYSFCCSLIGRHWAADCSRDLWDKHGEWWMLSLCSWCTLWTDEDRQWLWQYCDGE